MTGVGSSPTLATCETSQVLLADVFGSFSEVLLFRPAYRLACLDISEIILKGNKKKAAAQPQMMGSGLKLRI